MSNPDNSKSSEHQNLNSPPSKGNFSNNDHENVESQMNDVMKQPPDNAINATKKTDLPSQDATTHEKNTNHHMSDKSSNDQLLHSNHVSVDPQKIPWSKPKPTSTTNKPKKNRKNKDPKHTSPKQNEPSPKSPPSPIQLENKFGPLLRPTKSKSSSSSSSNFGSSSDSGPLFPPGFEDYIPAQEKLDKERKRKRKLEKKKKLKHFASNSQQATSPTSPISHHHIPNSIHVEDVISMASNMGLVFDGPEFELRKRIENVQKAQQLNWVSNTQ